MLWSRSAGDCRGGGGDSPRLRFRDGLNEVSGDATWDVVCSNQVSTEVLGGVMEQVALGERSSSTGPSDTDKL